MPITKRRKNLLRADPTRTGLMRKAFSKKLDQQWKRLALRIHNLVAKENAFGLTINRSYSYCSTQINIIDSELLRLIDDYKKTIDPDDVIRWEDESHITVRYGLHPSGKDLEGRIQTFVRDAGPITLRIGKPSVFQTPEADVLKLDIDSPKLHQLNELLTVFPHTDTHPKYVPHLTIAYLKVGTGDKYTLQSLPEIIGKEFTATEFVFSNTEGKHESITLNAGQWGSLTSEEKLREFKEWLREQFGATVSGDDERALWDAYITDGFNRGVGRSYDDTRRASELESGLPISLIDSKDSFLRISLSRPETIEKVKLLAARTFEELDGLDATMVTQLGRLLVDGLITGQHPTEIARALDGQLQLGMDRAERIARHELIRAHAEGQLTAMEQLGVEEVGVAVEWSTAGDGHVCPLCRPLQGIVLKVSEARNMIPRHVNCRCAFTPANVGEDTDSQKRSSASIRDAIKQSRTKGNDAKEWGSSKPIGKQRPKSVLTGNKLTHFQYIRRNHETR